MPDTAPNGDQDRITDSAAKRCGHKHRCACGLGLPMRQHNDPNYSRQGFCDRPCAYCDNLDAEEADGRPLRHAGERAGVGRPAQRPADLAARREGDAP